MGSECSVLYDRELPRIEFIPSAIQNSLNKSASLVTCGIARRKFVLAWRIHTISGTALYEQDGKTVESVVDSPLDLYEPFLINFDSKSCFIVVCLGLDLPGNGGKSKEPGADFPFHEVESFFATAKERFISQSLEEPFDHEPFFLWNSPNEGKCAYSYYTYLWIGKESSELSQAIAVAKAMELSREVLGSKLNCVSLINFMNSRTSVCEIDLLSNQLLVGGENSSTNSKNISINISLLDELRTFCGNSSDGNRRMYSCDMQCSRCISDDMKKDWKPKFLLGKRSLSRPHSTSLPSPIFKKRHTSPNDKSLNIKSMGNSPSPQLSSLNRDPVTRPNLRSLSLILPDRLPKSSPNSPKSPGLKLINVEANFVSRGRAEPLDPISKPSPSALKETPRSHGEIKLSDLDSLRLKPKAVIPPISPTALCEPQKTMSLDVSKVLKPKSLLSSIPLGSLTKGKDSESLDEESSEVGSGSGSGALKKSVSFDAMKTSASTSPARLRLNLGGLKNSPALEDDNNSTPSSIVKKGNHVKPSLRLGLSLDNLQDKDNFMDVDMGNPSEATPTPTPNNEIDWNANYVDSVAASKVNWDLVNQRDKVRYFGGVLSPMLDEWLFLSGEEPSSNFELLNKFKITHIVNCATSVCEIHFPAQFNYLAFDLYDDASREEISSFFWLVLDFFETIKKNKGRVLVHCQQGVSRSSTFVILYLMFSKNWNFLEAHEYCKSIRPVVNPNAGFLGQLLMWKKIQLSINSSPGYKSVKKISPHKTFLLCSPRNLKNFDASSNNPPLDTRFVYIIESFPGNGIRGYFYIWIGKSSPSLLRTWAMYYSNAAKRIFGNFDIIEIKEGMEEDCFFKFFNIKKTKSDYDLVVGTNSENDSDFKILEGIVAYKYPTWGKCFSFVESISLTFPSDNIWGFPDTREKCASFWLGPSTKVSTTKGSSRKSVIDSLSLRKKKKLMEKVSKSFSKKHNLKYLSPPKVLFVPRFLIDILKNSDGK